MKKPILAFPSLLFSLSLCLFVSLTLPACAPNPNEQFIQGAWLFANETGEERSGSAHVYFEWQFSNGTFYVYQEIVFGKPLVSEGRYRILENQEDLIVLELFNVEGNFIPEEPYELRIQIDRENDTARIQKTLFERAFP